MALAHGYAGLSGQRNTLPIPGVVRGVSSYGLVNPGNGDGGIGGRFGSMHGEIFDGPQDESMGVANYMPIIQNMHVQYESKKKAFMQKGELVPLYAIEKTSDGYLPCLGHIHRIRQSPPEVVAQFIRAECKPHSGATNPTMILPLASDFEVSKEGPGSGFAAFAVQAVADVTIPDPVDTAIKAYPGDRLYCQYDDAKERVNLSTKKTAGCMLLGIVVIGFDTSRGDRQIKVCL